MKAKFIICILFLLLYTFSTVEAQRSRGGGKSFSAKSSSSVKGKSSSTLTANTGKLGVTSTATPKFSSSSTTAQKAAASIKNTGRAGRETRLRQMATDPKLGSADKGWIKQEINAKAKGQRSSIRVPPGKELAHKRGYEAAKGYSHAHSELQARELHKIQHKHDSNGKKQTSQPKSGR